MSNKIKVGDKVKRLRNTSLASDGGLFIKVGDAVTVKAIRNDIIVDSDGCYGPIRDFKKVEPTTIEQLSADIEELLQKAEELGEQIKQLQREPCENTDEWCTDDIEADQPKAIDAEGKEFMIIYTIDRFYIMRADYWAVHEAGLNTSDMVDYLNENGYKKAANK